METRTTTASRHPGDDELVLFFYRDLDDRQTASIGRHLETCPDCRRAMRTLQSTLGAVDGHSIPEPVPGYEATVCARVQRRLDDEQAPASRWPSWFAPRRLVLTGAIALLVVAAFVAGRYSSAPRPVPTRASTAPAAPQPAGTAAEVRERVLLVAVGDHLERSQMVLVELMNSPTGATVDISGAQEWARDLVPANRLIRQTANRNGENVMAAVLDDLERLLVEIANSPSRIPAAELQQIRERIEAQGIVFKIRVLDSEVRERERTAPALDARRAS